MKPLRASEPSAKTYVVVWVALVVLATLTLFVSRDFGIAVALVIASAKAGLVLAFFMHLAYGRALHRFVIAVAVSFVVLLVVGVLADVGTRSIASAYRQETTP